LPLLGEGDRGPHLTQSRLGRGLPPYKWHLDPCSHFATTDMGKIEGLCPFGEGELSPHLTQCVRGRGLPACQVSSWSIQPFGHSVRTSQPGQTDGQTGQDKAGQRSDSIGRTVFGRPFVRRFALCYRTVVCPVLSVTLVYCGQTVRRIKMKLGTQVGLGPGHIVLGGDPAPPPPKGGGRSPQFWPISVVAKWLDGSRCHLVWR